MYQELLEAQKKCISEQRIYKNNDRLVEKAVETLNTQKMVTISGIRHSGKTKLVHAILKKTQSFEHTFYFNKEIDTLGVIRNKEQFITLFDLFVRVHGIPKIVVIQHGNEIEGIKELISQLYKTQKYKIIIVGNNIKIDGIIDIELFPLPLERENIEAAYWGGIPEVRIVPDIGYKKFLLQALKHDIIHQEVLEAYTIKNVSSFSQVLSFLALQKDCFSLREIHRTLGEHGIDISLLTLIDYINAALNTRILSRCYLYDIKAQAAISSKICYYFGDVGIRRSFHASAPFYENLIYLELKQRGYEVSSGLNGRFHFSFRAMKNGKIVYCDITESTESTEIRQRARKLAKIGDTAEKYVLIPQISLLSMRKFEEAGVSILSFEDFVSKI